MPASRNDPGCTCAPGDAVEYHGHRAACPATPLTPTATDWSPDMSRDEVQPYPVMPGPLDPQRDSEDARYECWFHPAVAAVALGGRHSGGDLDAPAHWLPICEACAKTWHDDVDEDERLPLIPRNGVALSAEQAEAVLARLSYYVENNDESVDEAERDAYDALATGLRALNDQLES